MMVFLRFIKSAAHPWATRQSIHTGQELYITVRPLPDSPPRPRDGPPWAAHFNRQRYSWSMSLSVS